MSYHHLGVYVLYADLIFRSRQRGVEADLPQPVDGEPRCLIVANDGDSPPRPYRNRRDLEDVISEEMRAIPKGYRWWDPRTGLHDLVEYYEDTHEAYAGRLADLNTQIARINKRGEDAGIGTYSLAVALAA